MLDRIRKNIDASLNSFLKKARHEYKLNLVNPILYESIREFTLREGKRIRPLLLILSYQGYRSSKKLPDKSVYYASTCMELLHNFMLIHDDIIDQSDLRRGKPALHKLLCKAVPTHDPQKLGYDLSIVAGDILYALAIDAFLSINEDARRKEAALKYFIKTAAFTAMGEFIDILHGVQNIKQISEKDVFLNYSLKTARYTFECPLVIGALLAGAPGADIKKLSRMGLMIGQAFQIQDDILGVFGSQKAIGKSILSDIAEFKKTLLVCHAYHHLPLRRKKVFLQYFTKTNKRYSDLIAIRRFFLESGSLQYSLDRIADLTGHSTSLLSQLNVQSPYRQLLTQALMTLFKTSSDIAGEYSAGRSTKK